MIHRLRFHRHLLVSLLTVALVVVAIAQTAFSQAVKSTTELEKIAIIEKLTVRDGVVSGEVVNRSANRLRDVQLFVRYTWLWDDEMKPGKVDPGTSTFYTLTQEIVPKGRLPFTFTPSPPLPRIAGGHFETSVTIAGFAQVIEAK
ncbi:MAG TPA: hypothetical protein VFK65_16940 [Candidatus Binatia bacterium]|nr:hypothetical protein [Candidatus Binatia bacterium]